MMLFHRWAEVNRAELNRRNSPLEFKLHRLRYIELIKHGADKQKEILDYARRLAPFAGMHIKGNLLILYS